MKPVYLCGQSLACALGIGLDDSLKALHKGAAKISSYDLGGGFGESVPYYAISEANADQSKRARELIVRVANEAGAAHAREGALFIATSSFHVGMGASEENFAEGGFSVLAGQIATLLNWIGPVYVVGTACTSSLNALLSAHALIREGEVHEALVLGLEFENAITLRGFAALQLLSKTGVQPFGKYRDGLVLGEAVAALRLSSRQSSQWKMLGGANVVDGRQPTGASVKAVVDMYQRALNHCGLSAEQIDLIKVQASGSRGDDAVEAQGLRAAFDAMPALVSLKSALGHTLGASGAAEIALLCACLEQGLWPKSATEFDEALEVALASDAPESVRRMMVSILGFGGSHSTVVLERS